MRNSRMVITHTQDMSCLKDNLCPGSTQRQWPEVIPLCFTLHTSWIRPQTCVFTTPQPWIPHVPNVGHVVLNITPVIHFIMTLNKAIRVNTLLTTYTLWWRRSKHQTTQVIWYPVVTHTLIICYVVHWWPHYHTHVTTLLTTLWSIYREHVGLLNCVKDHTINTQLRWVEHMLYLW